MRILLASHNRSLARLIRRCLARFRYQWVEVVSGIDAFETVMGDKFDLILLEFDLPSLTAKEILKRLHTLKNFKVPPTIVFTLFEAERESIEKENLPQTEVIARPIAIREFVTKVQQILNQRVQVVCVGGGTGLFTLLSGLKTISGIHLVSIVSMSDDGGSTGKLRDMFGILPPGDVRRSLVALSTAPDLLNELMQYRFNRGDGLKGHNLGNLILTALSEMRGSMTLAVKSLSEILDIQGEVIPVTDTNNLLKAELENGEVIEGEHRIDLFEGRDPELRIRRLWQEPEVSPNPLALEALRRARYIILGPGDLYTSVISNLVVPGIAETIASSRAKKIYVCNVMTKAGETSGFQVSDHVREIIKYLKADCLHYVLCSSSRFSKDSLKHYATQGQIPVVEYHKKNISKYTAAKIMWADVASESELVRHDSLKLAMELKKIFKMEERSNFR